MFQNKRIMIVVAHPDDEILGIGATMHKMIKEQKVMTHVVILGEGITSRSDQRDAEKWEKELSIHKANILAAQKVIGYHTVSIYDFPDNRFDSVPLLDIIKIVEHEKENFNPDIIFTHHGGDLNVDHQLTFKAVITATRPMEGEHTKTIITFETPSGTEWQASSSPFLFTPNLYVRVSENDVKCKNDAMEKYQFEKRAFPHPRSTESLIIKAQNRGVEVGTAYAEAFCVIRSIIE